MRKTGMLIYILLFIGIIVIPFLFANREENTISEAENRYLSNVPTATFGTEEYKGQLENWLNDNMAFRSDFLDIRALLLYKVFNTVSSEKVEKGKGDWLFYTLDSNLEIAKGGYPIDEDLLQEIASIQQEINDYYERMGKKYILVLTPSKVSIYPEKLYGNYSVRETPCDILYTYLKEHTTVTVINTKEWLIDAKEEGLLFWKTDTHWTPLGGYYAYKSILDVLNDEGILKSSPIEVKKTVASMEGGLADMIGCGNFIKEIGDSIEFTSSQSQVTSGEYYNAISALCEKNEDNIKGYYVYENEKIEEDLKLLIYGSSMFLPSWQVPQLLAENFSQVTMLYHLYPNPIYEIDSVSDADVVIVTGGERYIYGKMNQWPQDISVTLPDIEIKGDASGDVVVCVDAYNYEPINNRDKIINICDSDTSMCTISGWAMDEKAGTTFSEVFLRIGSNVVKGKCVERNDLITHFNDSEYKYAGFEFNFRDTFLYDAEGKLVDSLELIFVAADGSFMYEPVKYQINTDEEIQAQELPEIPIVTFNDKPGFLLDAINGTQIMNKQELSDYFKSDDTTFKMSGWAVDFVNQSVMGDVYLQIEENVIKGVYGIKRNDVAEYFSNDAYLHSGFTFEFDRSLLFDDNGELEDEISFVLVGKDGTFMYEPIVYKLGGEE